MWTCLVYLPRAGYMRQVGQDNWGNLLAVDKGDKHCNSIGNIDCGVQLTWTINII